jgi:DNA-binding beta-propeller fold protein YncE
MNGHSSNISVLDALNGKIVTTIALPAGPEFAVSDGKAFVYVNIEDKSEIVKIDSRTNKIVATWPLTPGEGPTGLALDRKSNTLFAGCHNQKLIMMNARNGKIESVLPIGKGVDAVAFDSEPGLAFSSNGEGSVTIVGRKDGKYAVLQTLETQHGARTIALDTKTHDIYLSTAGFGPTPAATTERPHPRPSILPGTFTILKYGELK